jgi:hypothetical protein
MRKPATPPEPPYLAKLRDLARLGVLRPGAQDVAVYHDPWCSLFAGKACNCDPEIEVLPAPADAARN